MLLSGISMQINSFLCYSAKRPTRPPNAMLCSHVLTMMPFSVGESGSRRMQASSHDVIKSAFEMFGKYGVIGFGSNSIDKQF
jgi:hypothetical protein